MRYLFTSATVNKYNSGTNIPVSADTTSKKARFTQNSNFKIRIKIQTVNKIS